MKNRQVYAKDPSTRTLKNEGVANVNDEESALALEVLRYELETFVCDGQYDRGMEHILDTYLRNIGQPQQPAVWVSGFYGSGKSHLVKMLRALWVDTEFPDGATARGIANLPQAIQDHFKELSIAAKRHGGLHAASGTLGAGASGSVRLALLRIVFKSAGLPEQYSVARFVMWLRGEGIHDRVRAEVEDSGYNWIEELDNFYVAEGLHAALMKVKPTLFSSRSTCAETLVNLYPHVQDISSDEMIKCMRQALTKDGKLPLTLIVLDEVQQFIGEDGQRSLEVQEAVESCCKNIGGKLLFIGTGQTAVTGTSNLKKLEGRFTIRVELSDADVDAVIRQVILAKRPDAIGEIESVMQRNLGEISRHLANTSIGHRQADVPYFAQDYPILPVRRRFWETTLRVLDQTGTDSQLRNQLGMVHKVIQGNLESPVGCVIAADLLYFDSADKLLQARKLPRKVHERTMKWIKGAPDEQLMARACGLVFLINKLAGSNTEVGIRASLDTIADLMVEDLGAGSSGLRNQLRGLLDKCDLLIKVGDEYRIQTEESAAWNDEFLSQRGQLGNEAHRVEAERDDRIRRMFGDLVKRLSLRQGIAKVNRDIFPLFESRLPADSEKRVYLWVRDEWATDENSVRADARQAGNESPTVFVFIPKRSPDDLRHQLMDYKAATGTLERRGTPNGPEGQEARAAMETTKQTADGRIKEYLGDAFSGARVFQGGGSEIVGNSLQEMVLEAAEKALVRLYPQFQLGDHPGWDKVYTKAKQGAPDALTAVGSDGEPSKNPVCKAILTFVAGGKRGADIRGHFEGAPYGWPGDTVDGALQVLLVSGLVKAQDERGRPIDPKELERKAIGKSMFKVESTTVTTSQRIQIRKVLQRIGVQAKQGEELAAVPEFLRVGVELANRAGGAEPKPIRPDTSGLEEIRLSSGNEQLLAIYNRSEELKAAFEAWEEQAKRIEKRWPTWEKLMALSAHAGDVKEAQEARQQIGAIQRQRLLLADPDPIQPLLKSLEDALRSELTGRHKQYSEALEAKSAALERDESWRQLSEDERSAIYSQCGIVELPKLRVGTYQELVAALEQHPVAVWRDRIDALGGRFDQARENAARSLEPEKTQTVEIPRLTLKTEEDVDNWVAGVAEELKKAVAKGPVVIR
ncbi:MAG: BREX system P-loop protein BrxC [Acidobacteria bacterium]|nr:BREX system P-loop protein BrxC [Acidobacteriota bacterium]